jgi:histidinol dehydrogenase
MLKRLDLRECWGDPAAELPRPRQDREAARQVVREIVEEVGRRGDAAVRHYTKAYDQVELGSLEVPRSELEGAARSLDPELSAALRSAWEAVVAYHAHFRAKAAPWRADGLEVRRLSLPVARAGLYVPGGRARYPSSVLMSAGPARVAGVGELVLCVPPGPDGRLDQVTLAAADLAEVDRVFRIGGAQAVAAMAWGTESVPPVDVVAGPGNLYVSLAKQEVAGRVGVPSAFAGPSEVVVVADASAPPDLAAIDLVVQAEHGPDGLAWLVTWEEEVAEAVARELDLAVAEAPRRAEVAATLAQGGYLVLVRGPDQAMDVANAVAPEHLQLMVSDPEPLVGAVRHAGAVFVGPWSPACLGDYAAGPSHVLPTFGSARFASALGVEDFLKHTHVVRAERPGFERLAPVVVALAEAEGLAAHAESARRRLRR